jgi:hypothetical protein
LSKLDQFRSSSGRVWGEKHQKHIEVERLDDPPSVKARPQHKEFKIKFVQVPSYWMEQLEQARHIATYKLALNILCQEHKRKHGRCDEIILSSAVTGLPRATRYDAIKELVKLGLIHTEQTSRNAIRVVELVLDKPKTTTTKCENGKIPRSSWRT